MRGRLSEAVCDGEALSVEGDVPVALAVKVADLVLLEDAVVVCDGLAVGEGVGEDVKMAELVAAPLELEVGVTVCDDVELWVDEALHPTIVLPSTRNV